MSTVLCHGCGQPFPLPEGYERNKIQCPACGVICPVPAGAGKGGRRAPAERKPAPAPAATSFDPFPEEPPVEEPAPRPYEEPAPAPTPAPAPAARVPEMLFACRRCGRKVRRQGECPSCDGTPEQAALPFAPGALELDERPGEDEDDGTPYEVAGGELPRCRKCRKELAPDAVVCVACGYDQRRRKKHVREFQPLARRWETNWPLARRLTVYVAVQSGSLVLGGMVALSLGVLGGFLLSWVYAGLLLAFLLGTYDRLDLQRDSRGRVTVTRTWRLGFVPLAPQVTEVRGFEGVVHGQWHDAGFYEWFLFFWLLPAAVVPALFWWYYVINKSTYHVALARDHGHPDVYLYRGRSEEQMRDIDATVRDASGLRDVG
jgi:hypothetical protein